jgi:glycosyltransferase involved in cell wall biosynthesis
MKRLSSVAFIGNHLPRRCGIATFTHDLHRAVSAVDPALETSVVAMTDASSAHDYPRPVRFQVREEADQDYRDAAAYLNNAGFEVVSLQHEYGIFGGEAGEKLLGLLSRLEMPVVTTLHTVLSAPAPAQRKVMGQIIERSSKLIVMSEKGRQFLESVHGVPTAKIAVIPHGIPEFPFIEPQSAKARLGFEGKSVILTFGLLSPSKGIETVIDAMPGIIRSCPNAVYVVLGATHPNLVRDQGEAYREGLQERAHALGIADHVVFLNQFVDQATLLDYISICDVYVTPYLSEAQMTSGTLAYSFGLGKAVVSTPYWHAQELLADGRGVLVPFGDASAIGGEISSLLTNDVRRHAMRKRAYTASRSMIWSQTARNYISVFAAASATDRPGNDRPRARGAGADPIGERSHSIPEPRTDHLLAMCDSTGLLQHAVHSIPDRSHGYCVDDNARALLLACALGSDGELPLPQGLTTRFAAFIQHAWNPDTRRFRNFMSYERRWLEDVGSEDSHGRTLWSLGKCAATDTDLSRRKWAAALFETALAPVENFTSPRAWAFTLLGLDAHLSTHGSSDASRLRRVLADRLVSLLAEQKSAAWHWFENVLAYDNARLPQALIETGRATATPAYIDAGITSLRWLMAHQMAPSGHFRPVGSDTFGKIHQRPAMFDQQPVEATATIAACVAAAQADSGPEWTAGAKRAFGWFLGDNDLHVSLVDIVTGGCYDGLHPDRPNLNMGAESVLSYLLALVDIRRLAEAGLLPASIECAPALALSA